MTQPARTSHRSVIAGVVLGALLALLTQAPAQWVATRLDQISHGTVLLQDAQGTLWNGSAQAVLANDRQNSATQVALPTRVHWTLAPQLQDGRLAFRLNLASNCCTPTPIVAHAMPSWNGWVLQVDDHQSEWPAQWLTGLGAPWNTIAPQGTLRLRTQQLVWRNSEQRLQGQVELVLHQFSTQLSTVRPLGSYKISLVGGDRPSFALSTLEGALQMQGHGEWRQNKVRFQGKAFAQEGSESAVSNLLNVLGQRQGNKAILRME